MRFAVKMNSPIPNYFDAQNAAAFVCLAARAYGVDDSAALYGALQSIEGSAVAKAMADRPTESHPTVVEDTATETRAVVYHDDEDLVVAFRGTMDLRNWMTDLDIATVSEDGCKIHLGFWRALESVFDALQEAVRHECAGRRVWLTGHSLGGALAVLYAWRSMTLSRSNSFSGIYTFGQPRVGNAAFRDSWPFKAGLDGCLFRVTNAVDIVPHLPWLCGRYRHCGHEVFYPGAALGLRPKAAAYQLDGPAWLYALRDVLALVSETVRPSSVEEWIADHHVGNYVNLFNSRWGETLSNPNFSPSIMGSTESRPTGNAL